MQVFRTDLADIASAEVPHTLDLDPILFVLLFELWIWHLLIDEVPGKCATRASETLSIPGGSPRILAQNGHVTY